MMELDGKSVTADELARAAALDPKASPSGLGPKDALTKLSADGRDPNSRLGRVS